MGNTPDEMTENYIRYLKLRRGNSDSTIRNETRVLKRFFKWLGENGTEIGEINQEIVDKYLIYCREKYARNSLVPITITLRKFFALMEKDIEVKVAAVKAPNREKQALTREEIKAMFKSAEGNPLETAVLKTLYYSGMRENELISLDIRDVDFDRLQITIKHGKGDRYRIVNITSDCAEAIKRWLQVRPKPTERYEDVLFLSPSKKRMSPYHVWKIVTETGAKAGVTKKVYPHLMRVCHITHSIEAGLSPKEIQVQSGHHDIGTLMGYVQHTPERIRRSYERAFGDNEPVDNAVPRQNVNPEMSNEYLKKIATQKYLLGEINVNELHSMLSTLEEKGNKGKIHADPSYI